MEKKYSLNEIVYVVIHYLKLSEKEKQKLIEPSRNTLRKLEEDIIKNLKKYPKKPRPWYKDYKIHIKMKTQYIIDTKKTAQLEMKDNNLKDMKDFYGIRIGVGNHILDITEKGFAIWKNGCWLIDGSLFLEDGEILIDKKVEEKKSKGSNRIFKIHIDLGKEIKEKEKELKTLKQMYNKETIKELEK